MMRLLIGITIAVAAACGQSGSQQEAPADSVATSPDTVPTHPDSAVIQRYRAMLPDSILARRNACPFECCVYGTWVADTAIPMYREARVAGTAEFTVAKGDSIRTETGIVFVTSIALVVADDTILIGAKQRPAVLPGDTLVLLDPIGEGYWTAWRRGEIIPEVPPFFESWMPEGKRGRLIGTPDREWWVKGVVKGRTGWFRPDRYHVRGSDACG